MAASGVPGYESSSFAGMFAPAKTAAPLINQLNREIVQVLNAADVKEQLFNSGVEMVATSPDEFAARIRSDMSRMGKMIKDTGIRAE